MDSSSDISDTSSSDEYFDCDDPDNVLFNTVVFGKTDEVQKLIDYGVNINSTDDEGKTALMHSVIKGKEDIVKLLINCGADIDISDNQGRTALVYSILNYRKSILMLLIECKANVNVVDHKGIPPLKLALMHHGKESMVVALINVGADTNIKYDHENSALMHAVRFGKKEIVGAMIKAGADVNIVNQQGMTALMIAARYGWDQIASQLIDAGAHLNIADKQGNTALFLALRRRYEEIALSLINAGADVNMMDHEGKTAVIIASVHLLKKAALSLINAGADVSMVDHKGETALHYASISSEELTVLLIEKEKTLLNIRDIYGRTPLFYAILWNNLTSCYLAEQGGDLHVRDNHNVTPLSFLICQCIGIHARNACNLNKQHINQILALFKEKGVTKKEFFQTLINVLFCKLLSFRPMRYSKNAETRIYGLIEVAVQIYGKFTEEKWKYALEYINSMFSRDEYKFPVLKEAMTILIDLGADPDTADEDGNTAIHYATQQILFGQSAENVLKIFNEFQALGSSLVRKNFRGETPLLFLLSELRSDWNWQGSISTIITGVTKICKRIKAVNPICTGTTANGESIFHLLINIFQQYMAWGKLEQDAGLILHLLELYAPPIVKYGVTVNKVDDKMSSPVHVWASLSNLLIDKNLNFEKLLEAILNHLKRCGAVLYIRNAEEQTPLHLCRTWSAVKLLINLGAKPGVVDSDQRSPFLVAAQKQLFHLKAGCFYPDVTEDAVTFWKTAADMKLDLWAYDVNGNSVFSILIASEEFVLAKSLLEIACNDGYIKSDETLVAVLSDICEDESTKTTWKELLVKEILKTISRPMDMKMPLRHCCRNIKNSYKEHSFDSVHWQIAKKLLSFGAEGSCCLDIAEGYPELHALLAQPLDMDEVPLAIPWTSHSHNYASKLAQVTRRQHCQIVEMYWYHTEPIGKGVFGHVFAGINSKDGMEVAVKRIENLRLERRQEREAYTFASLTGCRNVVHYLAFCTDVHFSFIILELMEGNLNEYFESPHFNSSNNTTLCRDVFCGINYLHGENIVHRDIKPTNILYKTHPELCVKIADFDLSRRLDIDSSFTVMAPGVGSRGWIAPEVVKSTPYKHSMESDIFSCGLITHYIFSPKKHPFYPTVCTGKSELQINQETEKNISDGEMKSFDGSIAPEASDCIRKMLDINEKERPTAEAVLKHPMFWSNKKKMNLLTAVGNQPEFEEPRVKRTVLHVSPVELVLESNVSTIVKYGKWDDPRYTHMPGIYSEMTKPIVKPAKKGKYYTIKPRNYDVTSVVDLVRFIRNSIAHVSDVSRPSPIRNEILGNTVFLEYFPNITMEVYNAVTKHGWSLSREEIQHAIADK